MSRGGEQSRVEESGRGSGGWWLVVGGWWLVAGGNDEMVVMKWVMKWVFEDNNEFESDTENVIPEVADPNAVIEEVTECMKTPRATLYEHNETPGGSIYWEPHVQGIPIPVKGTYYDTVDEAVDMYTKYAEMGGFEVKKSGQRLTKSGAVKHKYIMCNREGVPKGINVDTLDPEYSSDKQKRNTTTHVTGCKARIKLVLNIVTGRYKLEQFHAKHNHMLIPKEYKHFTKKQRQMTQGEKMFVVKAATNKIGATRAHNLLSSMKGGYEYVHGTTDDFKNHQRDVNVFIGESDAQMLINKMENRKMYVPNFTFQYKVENSELVAMFWADEVAKCNYKEFGDIVSFDATFNNNKSKIENSFFKSFTSPGATLVSFMMSYESAMERQRYRQEALDFKTIDAALKCETELAIERHVARVYTRTIFLLVQTEIIEGCWSCTIQDLKINKGCETVIIRDKKPNDNRSLNTKKGKEQEKKTGIVAEAVKDYKVSLYMFVKNMKNHMRFDEKSHVNLM
ncbi:FAR1-related sequence 5-like protein [Tanacetum coccineum]|uniref:FAR1-related sequence 5-like protein n=1 Tax=Tanacetum coccineum TaxID=301880 RepID=A0ABQ5GFC3_9ASTR